MPGSWYLQCSANQDDKLLKSITLQNVVRSLNDKNEGTRMALTGDMNHHKENIELQF